MVVSDRFRKNPSPMYQRCLFHNEIFIKVSGVPPGTSHGIQWSLPPVTTPQAFLSLSTLSKSTGDCFCHANLGRTQYDSEEAREPACGLGTAAAGRAGLSRPQKDRAWKERTGNKRVLIHTPRRSPLEDLRIPSHLSEAFSRPAVIGRPFPRDACSAATQLVRANGSPYRSHN